MKLHEPEEVVNERRKRDLIKFLEYKNVVILEATVEYLPTLAYMDSIDALTFADNFGEFKINIIGRVNQHNDSA